MDTCKTCNKKTKNMYRLNAGTFCEDHFQLALHQQDFDLRMEALKDRAKAMRKKWETYDSIPLTRA